MWNKCDQMFDCMTATVCLNWKSVSLKNVHKNYWNDAWTEANICEWPWYILIDTHADIVMGVPPNTGITGPEAASALAGLLTLTYWEANTPTPIWGAEPAAHVKEEIAPAIVEGLVSKV